MKVLWFLPAAGRSQRFGSNKLLAGMADGKPLIHHTLRALPAGDEACVVIRCTGADSERLRSAVMRSRPAPTRILACPTAEAGMGSTIGWGVHWLRQHGPEFDVLAILPADMPCIRRDSLLALRSPALEGREESLLRVASCDGVRGHPVLFGRAWLERLAQLVGDRGGKALLTGWQEIEVIETDDPGVLLDVDTPAKLHELQKDPYCATTLHCQTSAPMAVPVPVLARKQTFRGAARQRRASGRHVPNK